MPGNNAPVPEKPEELKKAEEALAIAKAEKEKAENDKLAAQAITDKVKAELEKEKLEATSGLGLLQAQADFISKLFPKGEAKPLEGKVEAKDVGSIVRLAAFHSIRGIAPEIATKLKRIPDNIKLMIVPQLDFASGDLPLLEIMEQFQLFRRLLTKQIEVNEAILKTVGLPHPSAKAVLPFLAAVAPAAAAIGAAGSIIKGLADLAGYFKTDYAVAGYEFDLDKESLAAAVASTLAEAGKEVYLYNFYTLLDFQNLPIMKTFVELRELSSHTEALKSGLIAKKDQGGPGLNEDVDRAVKDSQMLLDAIKSYIQSITSKAAGEDYPKLVCAALRDRIHQMGITHLLYLNILPKSGGESITKKKTWPGEGKVEYLGGAAVCYVLAEKGGRIVASDLLVRLSVYNHHLADPEKSTLTSIPVS
jgi:hypothetical protein